MSCNVCVLDDCDDVWSEYTKSIGPISHEVACYECRDKIPAGVPVQVTEAWPDIKLDENGDPKDEPDTYYTCVGCSQVREAYSCGTEVYGDFWSRLFESNDIKGFSMSGECWDNLGAEGKIKLQARWRREIGL